MTDALLTSEQLATRWCLSPKTLRQWRWQGQGPRFLKLGGRVVYRFQDVQKFEEIHLRQNTIKEGGG